VSPVTPEVMTSSPTVQVTTLAPVEDTTQGVTTMPPAVIQEVEDAAAEDLDTDINDTEVSDTEVDIPQEESTDDSDPANNSAGGSSAATGVDESNESNNSAVRTFGCVGAAAVVGCAFLLI